MAIDQAWFPCKSAPVKRGRSVARPHIAWMNPILAVMAVGPADSAAANKASGERVTIAVDSVATVAM